jgi:PIN domain nuclease of toxin-antitoxin system
VSLLLDTHVLLWWLAGDPLADGAAARIADPTERVVVSTASIWEATIKRSLGKLRIDGSLAHHAADAGFELLPVLADHAEAAGGLPHHHRDPFDRMLVAQATAERLTVVTRDPAFRSYDVDTVPA